MGGYGSGRWSIKTKEVVENCLILDLGTLLQGRNPLTSLSGTLSPCGSRYFPTSYRTYPRHGDDGEQATLVLYYNLLSYEKDGSVEREPVREEIPLTRTRLGYDRERWVMRCPLIIDDETGERCNRISRRLYLSEGRRYFGCRECHDLSYQSSRDNHRHEDLYRILSEGVGGVVSPDKMRKQINRRVREGQVLRERTEGGGLLAAFDRKFG